MDYQRLDSETLDEVLNTLKKFGEKYFPKEKRLEFDKNDTFPEELIRKMLSPDIGLQLVFLPEEYDGFGGGAYDIYRVSEEMAKIDLGMATAFLAISLGTDPIRVGGTEQQKKQWMEKIANEGIVVAYGATEPSAGSDLASLRTKAEQITDDSGKVIAYKLNGIKQFITNGSVADLYSILAVTPGGPSFFLVEKGTAGLSSGKPEEKHGIRLSNTSQVILEDVEVPAENLIGLEEGQGIKQAVAVFGYTRLMVAAFGLGAGEAALDCALRYAKERAQFGKNLIELQGYVYKLLLPHAVHLEAARAFIEESADRLDSGEQDLETEGAVAKLFATETGNQTAEAAIQALGGYGYTHEYEVEKIKRDVRITIIYEGTSEIMQQTIGKNRWRQFLQSRGEFYLKMAREMDELNGKNDCLGAGYIARAIETMAECLEQIRQKRLTRQQHVLFQMAQMMTAVETGCALCRRAANKQDHYLSLAARIYAADVSSLVSQNSLHCLGAFACRSEEQIGQLRVDLRLDKLDLAQLGLAQAMEEISEILKQK